MTKKQRATTPGAGRRILTPPPCRWSIPPTTEEWGEGKGEGIPISSANSMEGAPLPSPLPARASQGEGAVASAMVVVFRSAPCQARSSFRLRSVPYPWKLPSMTREKSFFGLLGRAFFLHSRKRTQRTQRSLRALSGRFLCALCVLLRPILRFRLRRPRLFAAAAVVLSQSLCAQTPRLEVIHAMLQRPHDPL